jgi:hypothetical protein
MNKTTILLIVGIAVLAFAVGTATSVSNVIIPAVQAAKKSNGSGSGGSGSNSGSGGSVPLTAIKTGDTTLDKTIQSFYNCIKKTGHTGGSKPEPSKSEVIDCYYKEFGSNE